ncbi:MAG: hypothetical protein GX606_06695, partial [Elusimicrobia bacterium]|nr:hypothetical protein [Elusimicrobiota bacterium]
MIRSQRGVILVTVLWTLLLLALFAIGLGRVGAGEMGLLKCARGRLKAYAAARSGILYTEALLVQKPSYVDRLGMSGVALPHDEQEKAFSRVDLAGGTYFSIQGGLAGAEEIVLWGPEDETGRFDLNMVGPVTGVGARIL